MQAFAAAFKYISNSKANTDTFMPTYFYFCEYFCIRKVEDLDKKRAQKLRVIAESSAIEPDEEKAQSSSNTTTSSTARVCIRCTCILILCVGCKTCYSMW